MRNKCQNILFKWKKKESGFLLAKDLYIIFSSSYCLSYFMTTTVITGIAQDIVNWFKGIIFIPSFLIVHMKMTVENQFKINKISKSPTDVHFVC